MKRVYIFAALLALSMALGCKAQPATQLQGAALNRRIEGMVRSTYNIPEDYMVTLGVRSPSQIPGYDTLPVSIGRDGKVTVIDFLVSTDGKTLAHLDKFDLAAAPNVDGRPIRGNPAAKVTVVNYDDLECPFCARMHETLFPATLERYKDKVRFIYKDSPLTDKHPWAMRAAIDSNCLGAQNSDAYWQYVDYIHTHGQEVSGDSRDVAKSFDALDRIARQFATVAKLDAALLDACLSHQDDSQVRASMKEAEALRVNGVPALFINGEHLVGAVPQAQLWAVIDRVLRDIGEEPPPAPVNAPPVLPGSASTKPAK